MMRGGLISMLYGKATEVRLTDVDTASSLTLMSADIERIVTGMETGHEVREIFPAPVVKIRLHCHCEHIPPNYSVPEVARQIRAYQRRPMIL
jgi:hypothetical protein